MTVRGQHIAFNFHQAIEGFITNGGTPTGTATFLEQSNHPLFVGKSATYITQTLVGDAFAVCIIVLYIWPCDGLIKVSYRCIVFTSCTTGIHGSPSSH